MRGERGAGRGASGNKERLTTRRDRREDRRHDHHERKRNYLSFSLPISFFSLVRSPAMLSWYNVHKKGVLMTYRQWKFVEGFAIHGNATKAAREAGYSLNGVNRMGYYLKKRLEFELFYWSCTKKERHEIITRVLHDERRRLKLEQVIRLSEREGRT